MNRLFTGVAYGLMGIGLLALLGGLLMLNLTPIVMGSLLVGFGGMLLYLVRLYVMALTLAPSLKSLSDTARFLSLKESRASSRLVRAAEPEPSASVRQHPSRPVDPDGASSDHAGVSA